MRHALKNDEAELSAVRRAIFELAGADGVQKKNWKIRYVVPKQVYWSFYPARPTGIAVLMIVNWVFYSLGVAHEVLSLYQECLTFKDIGKVLVERGLWEFVLLCSFALPVIPELFSSQLRVSSWTLLVSIIELVMAVRTFVDGRVLKPWRVIVETIENAASTLFRFLFMVTAMAYGLADE